MCGRSPGADLRPSWSPGALERLGGTGPDLRKLTNQEVGAPLHAKSLLMTFVASDKSEFCSWRMAR